ncbi:MAG: hypothetical protein OQL16_04680 [Gammaproteobacteria bacterium]|nr:hypothetical protein [Gammaproteobacteria bacterium]
MDAIFISVIAMLFAAVALAYALNINSQYKQLRRDLHRTRLLNRMTECTVVIGNIMEDMGRYEDYGRNAFGDDPQDVPDLRETLNKVEALRSSFSDYSHETPVEKLVQATGQIEKVLGLMRGVAAKSPRLHSGTT